jgi:predicted  nucleic acid-binding Zn-ribbon protein
MPNDRDSRTIRERLADIEGHLEEVANERKEMQKGIEDLQTTVERVEETVDRIEKLLDDEILRSIRGTGNSLDIRGKLDELLRKIG